MHPALVWAPPLVGQVLGRRWQLERLLGAGGMGAVYEAVHRQMGRRAALKVIAPDLRGDPELIERFRREAYAAASLGVPGIVEVLDFDVDEQHGPFLVMELLRGEGLNQRLSRVRRLPPVQIAALGGSLLDTLAHVHARGIVHRDLKPGNIFFAEDRDGGERVKILDFGISRVHTTGRTMLTTAGSVLGTPRYMSPEQAMGAPDVDGRADIYGVGAVLYACATGRSPYADVADGEVPAAVIAGPPRPIAEIAPDIPDPLAAAITRALRTQRQDRFASAAEMSRALGGSAPVAVVSAVPSRPSAGGSPVLWMIVGAGALLGAALVAALAIWVYFPPANRAPAATAAAPPPGAYPPAPHGLPVQAPTWPPPPSTAGPSPPPGANVLGPVADLTLEAELIGGRTALRNDVSEARAHFQAVLDRTHGYGGRNEAGRARALALRGLGEVTVRELELAQERGGAITIQVAVDAYGRAARFYGESTQAYPDLVLAHCNWVGSARAAEVTSHALRAHPHAAEGYTVSARTLYRTARDNAPPGAIATCTEDALLGVSRLGP